MFEAKAYDHEIQINLPYIYHEVIHNNTFTMTHYPSVIGLGVGDLGGGSRDLLDSVCVVGVGWKLE